MEFSITVDSMFAAGNQFAAQPSAFYLNDLQKLQQWSKKCDELRGKYVE